MGRPTPASRIGCRAAADALAAAGYEIVDTVPPRFEEAIDVWTQFIVADIRMLQPQIGPLMSDDANRFLGDLPRRRGPCSTSAATPRS